MRKILLVGTMLLSVSAVSAQDWQTCDEMMIPVQREAKPYTRWWWLGSAVDTANISYNLEEYARAGIGGVEITPIYGVQGNDANDIPYLSPKWMRMLQHTVAVGERVGVEVNMSTGTGWPFGGPLVSEDDAAAKAVFTKGDDGKVRLTIGRTKQKVKRAAPGGEGFVIDHFDRDAVARYLQRFDTAFVNQGVKPPHTFFNDSYEVYGADWTPKLLEEFYKRRGYRLEEHFEDFTLPNEERTDKSRRIISDYRQTLGELLLENFTMQWTDWAHKHGAITRNQAHGSPANLIDIYAAVDIPECEGFGLSDFGIKGLRTDKGFTKKNDSDISMLKYASSAAHISGKKYTSSETFTWLTEHFRTSLSQCKPDVDLLFVSGVNHVFFHGSCYSPREAEWPGWRFYASVDMTPNNSSWRDMTAFTKYIERCQSFLQWGEPDNDLLVYLPYYDMIYEQPDRIALFDIHSMERRAPKFIQTIQTIIKRGYDVDYVSDKYLERTTFVDGHLTTTGKNAYAGIIVPDVRFMPVETLQRLLQLAKNGATVVFVKSLPESVPGYDYINKNARIVRPQAMFDRLIEEINFDFTTETVAHQYGKGLIVCSPTYDGGLTWCKGKREPMRFLYGLSCIRRSNPDGHHYFISNLQGKDVDKWVTLVVPTEDVVFYNPMTGKVTRAAVRENGGAKQVRLQLASGESVIMRVYASAKVDGAKLAAHTYLDGKCDIRTLDGAWTFRFLESAPVKIDGKFKMKNGAVAWTELGDSLCNATMATGVYSTEFSLGKDVMAGRDGKVGTPASIILDLGDVRESARVRVNGKECGTLFAVPFRIDITDYVKKGKNRLEVEVTNLPANRIAALDRQGVQWRKFKEINVVDLNYKKTNYAGWEVVPSGLNSPVRLLLY